MSKKKKSKKSKKLSRTPLIEELSLYQFQREAVDRMRMYISAFDKRGTKGSGLVHMPTGTGKTAVIAALSHCIPEVDSVLVLCPRIVLRDQLFRELQGNIFKKLKLPQQIVLPKSVQHLAVKKSNSRFVYKLPNKTVIVTTIQKLLSVFTRDQNYFSKLINRVDMVLFDEGHHEPALRWSEIVRKINKPRIIFTATPFRNDLKMFDVDLQHAYSYSFRKAVSESIIRDVNIISVKSPQSPEEFVKLMMKSYRFLFGSIPRRVSLLRNRARVIIRCDDAPQIRQMAVTLRSKRVPFVAIHEQFQDNDANGSEWKHVPNPRKTKALIWIHQHKLLEGVDDERFQLLAIYGKGPGSTRAMVQQVGRIVRNPRKKKNAKGYVLDTFKGEIEDQWSAYLKYDELIDHDGWEALNTNKRRHEALQIARPPTLYIDRRFRNPLVLDNFRPNQDLQLPLRVNVYYKEGKFSISKVAKAIIREFNEGDRTIAPPNIEYNRCVILSIRYRNSPYLIDKFFMEPKLCVTIVYLVGRYVCFFDSGNLTADYLPGFGTPVGAKELRRMLKSQLSTSIRRVSLVNSNIAPDSVQSRSVVTYSSIERTPPTFDDCEFVPTTADGRVDVDPQKRFSGIRRYIGFNNARLSQGSTAKHYTLAEYQEWLEKVAEILREPIHPHIAGLARYAEVRKAPVNTEPISVMLDFGALRDSYFTNYIRHTSKQPVEIPADQPIDIIQDAAVVEKGKFHVYANHRKCKVKVQYDKDHCKYRLESSELDETYYNADMEGKSVIQRLNAEQAFRIIPEASGVVYTAGAFHDPQIGLGPTYERKHEQILGVIHPFSIFGKINSEKGLIGVLSSAQGWEHNCLFGLIDRVGGNRLRTSRLTNMEKEIASSYFNNVDLLICDDMGTELADFIMVQSILPGRKNVVFIHCKALKPQKATKVSASGLVNVCSQAVKNIGELSHFSRAMVNRKRRWSQPWTTGKLGTVKKRIRKGPKKAKQAWDFFRDAVEDPNSQKEIWLFLGNILSKQEFENRLVNGARGRKLETMQALYVLFSTLTTIRSRNIHFLVFCNP